MLDPASANALATPRPIPLVEPVTNAILLLNILLVIDVCKSSTYPMVKNENAALIDLLPKRKFWIKVPSYRIQKPLQ